MSDLTNLPYIQFVEKDAAKIESRVVSGFESAYKDATGEELTLYPADPRRLFLLSVTDIIVQQRNIIEYCAKMNLLRYTRGGYMDHMGALLGVTRLPATAAVTTVRFTISTALAQNTVIPAGTRTTPDGTLYFATKEPGEILSGQVSADIPSECVKEGGAGNGFLPGQICRIVDPLPWLQSVSNITPSAGGADTEDDESLRVRIQLAPESFSVAGPFGAYEFWAKSAHPGIIDVAVVGPPDIPPGEVEIYPIMSGGELPTQDILDLVYATCNADDIRPLTDHVSVLSPVPVPYTLSVSYWINRTHATGALAIQTAVNKAISDWALWQRSKIGRDITPSKLVEMVMLSGAKRVEVLSPANRTLGRSELAVMEPPPTVIYGGLEDD